MPARYMGLPVFNGDESDLRFLDPKGVVVGLYAKGKAKKDTTGFVKYPVITLQAAWELKYSGCQNLVFWYTPFHSNKGNNMKTESKPLTAAEHLDQLAWLWLFCQEEAWIEEEWIYH